MSFRGIKFVLLTALDTYKLGIFFTKIGKVGMMVNKYILPMYGKVKARDLWKFRIILGYVVSSMPARMATEGESF